MEEELEWTRIILTSSGICSRSKSLVSEIFPQRYPLETSLFFLLPSPGPVAKGGVLSGWYQVGYGQISTSAFTREKREPYEPFSKKPAPGFEPGTSRSGRRRISTPPSRRFFFRLSGVEKFVLDAFMLTLSMKPWRTYAHTTSRVDAYKLHAPLKRRHSQSRERQDGREKKRQTSRTRERPTERASERATGRPTTKNSETTSADETDTLILFSLVLFRPHSPRFSIAFVALPQTMPSPPAFLVLPVRPYSAAAAAATASGPDGRTDRQAGGWPSGWPSG